MNLLYLGPQDTLAYVRDQLAEEFDVRFALDDTGVDRLIKECDVVLDAYMRVRFTEERLSDAAHLKLFVTATTGADHVAAAALARRGIPLLTLKGQREVLRNLTPAAEHSWLLLMACARQLRSATGGVLHGDWDRNKYPGMMLNGRTLGVIGCGRIGQWMARYAAAFGMTCLGYDPYTDPWPDGIQKVDRSTLLSNSDFISMHVTFNEETKGLLGPNEFKQMKAGAIIVNTSRGEILDEQALLSALTNGQVAAAGLDVLTGEPEVAAHPLVEYARTHENLIITPHIGGYSPDALRSVLSFSCRRISEYFKVSHE